MEEADYLNIGIKYHFGVPQKPAFFEEKSQDLVKVLNSSCTELHVVICLAAKIVGRSLVLMWCSIVVLHCVRLILPVLE